MKIKIKLPLDEMDLDFVYEDIKNKAESDGHASLTKAERVIFDILYLDYEVRNGGFDQYLFNSSGNYAMSAIESFNNIGAVDIAKRMKKICDFFPGGKIPEDREERNKTLHNFGDKERKYLSELDNIYFDYVFSVFLDLINKYIKANPD